MSRALVSRVCDDELCSNTYKISSPVGYFPVDILIKKRKLRIVTELPSDRLADLIASVRETNPVTEKSVPNCARKKNIAF